MKTFQFEVAGVKFRWQVFCEAKVMRGDRLTLRPEPTNQYDLWAIGVYKDEAHIGYVPKTHNKLIHEAVTGKGTVGPAAKPSEWPPDRYGCTVDAAWKAGCWVVVNIKEVQDGSGETGDAGTDRAQLRS